MKPTIKLFALLFIFVFTAGSIKSQQPKDLVFNVTTSITENPPSVSFTWDTVPGDSAITVCRKSKGDTDWGDPIAVLPFDATEYSDNTVDIGVEYEYRILKETNLNYQIWPSKNYTSYNEWLEDFGCLEDENCDEVWLWSNIGREIVTYISSGIKMPELEYRGKVILLVDSSFVDSLRSELTLFETDLLGDGWEVLRKDISRNTSVKYVKSVIRDFYYSDTVNVKSLILFGHIPVPYSGCFTPDGHFQEAGAWQADQYYGSMNEAIWTDEIVDIDTVMLYRRISSNNIPGDGKFDISILPDDEYISLQIGRIDLSKMPVFSNSEAELLSKYLHKDHAFRHKVINPKFQALFDDYHGSASNLFNMNLGAGTLRNFTALVNPSNVKNVKTGNYFVDTRTDSYLFSYKNGQGDPGFLGTNVNPAASTDFFVKYNVKSVFTTFLSSVTCNWDYPNNFLRAALASDGWPLTCCWEGGPFYTYHQMGTGNTIGYCVRATQNNIITYDFNSDNREMHVNLMGDPTLRMQIVCPVNSLQSAVTADSTVLLAWKPADDNILGYYIYKLDTVLNEYQRITTKPVTDTWYEDTLPASGNNYYMVKSYQLTQSASGSYYNLSQGVFDTINYKAMPPISVDSIELYLASSNLLPLVIHDPVKVNALVYPDSATNKLLKWSVENITANGKFDVNGNILSNLGGKLIVIAEALDGSGITDSLEINIDSIPGAAGSITGETEPCRNNLSPLYTVPEIRGSDAYQWTFPDGSVDTTLLNEIRYTINSSAVSGNLRVSGINPYGKGEESTLNITIYDIPEPPGISIVDNAFVSDVPLGNQWYRNDTLIEEATDDTYVPTMNGIYTSRVTVNNCTSFKSNKIRWTDIEVLPYAKQIKIYPNPAIGELTIEFEKEQTTGTTIELLDISGKVVYSAMINPGETQHQINLTSFEEGLYLIRISNTDYTVTKKVIKVE